MHTDKLAAYTNANMVTLLYGVKFYDTTRLKWEYKKCIITLTVNYFNTILSHVMYTKVALLLFTYNSRQLFWKYFPMCYNMF